MFRSKEKLQEEAQKFVSRGQYDKALKQYQKLVERDPTDVRVLIKLGDVHHRKGSLTEAITSYQQAGDRYADRGFHQKAIAVYKRILQLDKSRIDVNFRIGQLYEDQQLLGDAVTIYESTAEAYLRAGDSEKAMSIYQHMIELDPSNVALRLQFSELLSRLGKTERATKHLQETAQILRDEGRTQDYIKVAERLLFQKSGDITLAQELAQAYLESGDQAQALAKLHIAFQADANNTKTLALLGQAFEAIGKIEKAANVFREAARLHSQRLEYTECEAMLRKALALAPDDEKAQLLLERIVKERPAGIPHASSAAAATELEAEKSVPAAKSAAPVKNDDSMMELLHPQSERPSAEHMDLDVTNRKKIQLPSRSKWPKALSRKPRNVSANPLAPLSMKAFDDLPTDASEPPPVEPTRDSLSPRLEENLERIDNLMIEARFSEAEALISRLQDKTGQHPLIIGKKKTLEAMRKQPALPSLRAQGIGKSSSAPLEADVDLRPKFLNPSEVPSERVRSATPPPVPNLRAEFEKPTGVSNATAVQARAENVEAALSAAKKPRAQHVDRVLEDFRHQVAQQIDAADSQAHFDLGTAYRGMALYADARREFEQATQDPTRACISWTMVGQCWMDEGKAEEAVRAFTDALQCGIKEGVDELAVMFELGNAQEAAGNIDGALNTFTKIAESDSSFRDVSQRIQKIQDSGVMRKPGHNEGAFSTG